MNTIYLICSVFHTVIRGDVFSQLYAVNDYQQAVDAVAKANENSSSEFVYYFIPIVLFGDYENK